MLVLYAIGSPQMIRLLFSGKEHHVDIKDLNMVEDLRKMAKEILIARAKNVDTYAVKTVAIKPLIPPGSFLEA